MIELSPPPPFAEIETELLNDGTDQSSLTLDGIVLASANEWELSAPGVCPIQNDIHNTIIRTAAILRDYRDGKLVYKVGK